MRTIIYIFKTFCGDSPPALWVTFTLIFTLGTFSSEAHLLSIPTDTLANSDTIVYASPSVVGARRSKGLSVNYSIISSYTVESTTKIDGLEDATAEVRRLNELKIKLNAPLVLKPATKLILGVRYQLEEYNFENPQMLVDDVSKNLQDRNLHALELNFNLLTSLNERNFFLVRGAWALIGDFSKGPEPITRYLKYQASAVYGWKYNPSTSFGVGLSFNYTLGRPAIYPLLLYQKSFNDSWGLSTVFPAKVTFRHSFSEKTIILMGYELQGDSYHINIDDPPLANFPGLELRRSDLVPKITLEREIYDFLWMELTLGYRLNLNFNLSEDNSFSNEIVLENQVSASPLLSFGIFLVPPRKMATRYLKGKLP